MEQALEHPLESAATFTETRFAVIDGTNVVNVILWDGIETPNEGSQTPFRDSFGAQILLQLPAGSPVAPGWTYDGATFAAPPEPEQPPMTAAQALAMKTALIAEAAARIAPLQDMVDLGEASPEEEAGLLAWKRYRIALTRITSASAGWPDAIQWPAMPA